jgi:CheY-like chemotaxis protein
MDALALKGRDEMTGAPKPALRVLVIDDDACVGAAIQAILARRKTQTELAARALAGIQAVDSSRFDVVLVDLFMPGMTGLDTIAHIRRGSAIPIIAMSGFRLRNSANSLNYLDVAIQRGASTCIHKPFTPEQLIAAIDRSLASAPSARELMQ